ncbi:BAH_G0042970.mRNA.1.CDS.1 [Saccharomyces cerevisiae]|nr:BAH_G0042970.mRNA.1.CDS.1 [Saccharomyces cerevisiae]CAI7269595.1 BAH_G0042970.mRNA.1.CDS.1 [Saccharomyces cerevisiae]
MIVNNTHILTLPLYTTTTATCHTHFHLYTDMSYTHGCYKYIPLSNLPYSHIPLHGPSLTKSVLHSHHYARHCLSGLYPCASYPERSVIIHILISISQFGGPKYCITALNTYVIPLLHHILTT